MRLTEEDMKRTQIPPFGHWNYCEDLPITQYFESAWQAGLTRGHFRGDDGDLFKVASSAKPAYHPHPHYRRRRNGEGEKKQEKMQKTKQGKVSEVTTQQSARRPSRAPKAVDEDLYKIPPELLRRKPKRKRSLRGLLSGCISLNCVV